MATERRRATARKGASTVGVTVAVVAVVSALTVWAPARWLLDASAASLPPRLQVTDVHGTLWAGSLSLAFAANPGGQDVVALPSRIHWRLRPLWNGVAADITAGCCLAQPLALSLRLRAGGLELRTRPFEARVPAPLLHGLGAPLNSLDLGGIVTVRADALAWSSAGRLAEGRVHCELADVTSAWSTLRPLGTYVLDFDLPAPATVNLQTTRGALLLQGQGQWTAGRLHFAGEASAAPGQEQALANLLNIVGQRQGARSLIRLD